MDKPSHSCEICGGDHPTEGHGTVERSETPRTPEVVITPEDKTDFLKMGEMLRERGYEVRLTKTDSWETPMGVEHEGDDEFCGESHVFPFVSRSLRTVYDTRQLKAGDREPDQRFTMPDQKFTFGHYLGDWMDSTLRNPKLETFYDEGVIKLSSDKENKEFPLPTQKLDRPFYLVGGSDNQWLRGGGMSATSIHPISVDVFFSRINPNFTAYLNKTREKLEHVSIDKIIEAHVEINKKYELGLHEDEIRAGANKYLSELIPKLKTAVEGLLTGDERLKLSEDRLVFYKDGLVLLMPTEFPVVPMEFLSHKENLDLSCRYEEAMMADHKDPDMANLRWIDLATAFSIRVGSNTATYLTVSEEQWDQETAPFYQRAHGQNMKQRQQRQDFKDLLETLPEAARKALIYDDALKAATWRYYKFNGRFPDHPMFKK